MKALLSSTYFGPIQWYQKLNRYDECLIERHESFIKQTYRNRMIIPTTNGPLSLTIPTNHNTSLAMKDIRISEIFEAVDETVSALHVGAGASGGISGSRAQSLSNRLWESLSAQVFVFLHQTSLEDVVKNGLKPCPAVPSLFSVVDE